MIRKILCWAIIAVSVLLIGCLLIPIGILLVPVCMIWITADKLLRLIDRK